MDQKDYGGKDLWKRWVLSLERKAEEVIDGESEGGDYDEMMRSAWVCSELDKTQQLVKLDDRHISVVASSDVQ